MKLNVRGYMNRMMARKLNLLHTEPKDDIHKAILDLEMLICDINPYSRAWRYGRIKSLRLAIKALKKLK